MKLTKQQVLDWKAMASDANAAPKLNMAEARAEFDALCDLALQALAPTPDSRLRPEVLAFALLMEAQLKRNDYRGGWKDESPTYLGHRIEENMRDLGMISANEDVPGYHRTCADIANFAMMLADNRAALTAATDAEVCEVCDEDKQHFRHKEAPKDFKSHGTAYLYHPFKPKAPAEEGNRG